jgi:long-chain acyl-CoA synthetase
LPEDEGSALPPVDPVTSALIIYTSGTTSRPKGVVHTHRTLGAAVEGMWDLGPSDGAITSSSIMHPSGLYCIVLPAMMSGGTVVLIPMFDPVVWLDEFERHRCTAALLLPSLAQFVVAEQMKRRRDVSSIRWTLAGGDAVPVALQKQFQECMGTPLREGIAMTECCPMLGNPAEAIRSGSVGLPLPGVEAKVVGPDGRALATGEVGELVVRSAAVFAGYWNNPEETAATLRDGWLFTGDLVKCDAEGYFWFQGRKKQLIVRESYNVAPQEVEEVLYLHPAVFEAGVFGLPDPVFGEKVIAGVSLRPGQTTTEAELRDFARQRLNDLKVPEKILFLAELPKGLTGKVDRRALKEKALA